MMQNRAYEFADVPVDFMQQHTKAADFSKELRDHFALPCPQDTPHFLELM
ncbi:hypothetical protein ACLBKS_03220 [Hylemonella sp. W303a]